MALDLTDPLLQALGPAPALVLVHHPPLFHPWERVDPTRPQDARRLGLLARGDVTYAMHTNWDQAPEGTDAALAKALGLEEAAVLVPCPRAQLHKLVVFVPRTHEAAVRHALAQAGAGRLGRYEAASFSAAGTGVFRPLPGAHPSVGRVDETVAVEEVRIETLVGTAERDRVLAAMKAAHPYEEVAWDLSPAGRMDGRVGFGRIGRLAAPMALADFARKVGACLGENILRWAGDPHRRVERVAVVGGSGSTFLDAAARLGAEVMVTADVGHHRWEEARDLGLALVDAGHRATEEPGVAQLARSVAAALRQETVDLAVHYHPVARLWQDGDDEGVARG